MRFPLVIRFVVPFGSDAVSDWPPDWASLQSIVQSIRRLPVSSRKPVRTDGQTHGRMDWINGQIDVHACMHG
eukprot:364613-Chlamydomonas_euryale.AAC.14